MVEKTRVVIALGGNAILKSDQKGTYQEQLDNVQKTVEVIGNMILSGEFKVVVTHGNGPQIGAILLQNDAGESEGVPAMPMDVCGAQSQGMIGYMMQQRLETVFKQSERPDIPVATIITQTVVEEDDPAFDNPTKPVGPFYEEEKAKTLKEEKGWDMVKTKEGKWRRVVPSPEPQRIAEEDSIRKLYEAHIVPIVAGGGGIPVVEKNGGYEGREAVVDKDLAAERVAQAVDAEIFVIVTDVKGVALNYGEPDEEWLDKATVEEMREYLEEGHFEEGSMKPKVEAAIEFIENGGKRAIIGSLDEAAEAVEGKKGTKIVPR
ncbi:carbamate kinase [candidate division MSBL1 archaeon SCGC-AAA259J03]|uniref:Carbamate kinase n=2 Tax=candidate division MSBL1 TaxID=215777 RepID=A0A656YYH4_9EURY|nr:carbamate kinase [candidate division MSBL1 archaeon SCGC-AAA259B11]KXA98954.1 carbamate kinase [candidate division MSBL1 archaeon SCGC-AAA259J03]